MTRFDLAEMLLDSARSHGLSRVEPHVLDPWPHVLGRDRDGLPVVVHPSRTHLGVLPSVRPAWRRYEVGDGPAVEWVPNRGRRWRTLREMGRDDVAVRWRAS